MSWLFFSGSRADYGLIKPIVTQFKKIKINLNLLVLAIIIKSLAMQKSK